jgi:hypothetical protein
VHDYIFNGTFANALCLSLIPSQHESSQTSPDFDEDRGFLVDKLFKPHPAVSQYLQDKYKGLLEGERSTVALHFDVNSVWNRGQPAKRPSVMWYRHVISNYFVASQVVFLVFSANASKYGPFFAVQQQRDPHVRFVMIDEPEAVALTLMAMCKHHIVATSPLGFWGMCVCIFEHVQ